MLKETLLRHLIAIMKLAMVYALTSSATLAVAEQGASADEPLGDEGSVLQRLDSDGYVDFRQAAAPFVKAKTTQDESVSFTRQSQGGVDLHGVFTL